MALLSPAIAPARPAAGSSGLCSAQHLAILGKIDTTDLRPQRELTAAMAHVTLLAGAMPATSSGRSQGSGAKQQVGLATDPRSPIPRSRASSSGSCRTSCGGAGSIGQLRFKIDAFGHELIGTGNFLQFGVGAKISCGSTCGCRWAIGRRLSEIRGEELYWVRRRTCRRWRLRCREWI